MLRGPKRKTETNVVYEPAAGTAQQFALNCPVDELLICGSRGGGKSAVQLMNFRRLVGQGYGSFLRGVIFDREFKHLADIANQSKKLFYKFNDGAPFYAPPPEYTWKWPTGAALLPCIPNNRRSRAEEKRGAGGRSGARANRSDEI